jgi:hypothetical protein
VDPALARASRAKAGENQTIYRQFFFGPNPKSVKSITGATAGQGWMYAPLAMASGATAQAPDAQSVLLDSRNYLLVGTYDQIISLTPDVYELFAGMIITSDIRRELGCTDSNDNDYYNEFDTFNPVAYSPVEDKDGIITCVITSSGPRTGKPFMVVPGFSPSSSDVPDCPVLGGSNNGTGKCVLMLNRHTESEVSASPALKNSESGAGLFDIEGIRDFTMCGYYMSNPAAPSYLQRLLQDSYSRNDTLYGIETFVIGNFAGDAAVYGSGSDVNSRLDRELFSVKGIKIRGLPGCKTAATCSDTPLTGIFALGQSSIDYYGLGAISCGNGLAGCNG